MRVSKDSSQWRMDPENPEDMEFLLDLGIPAHADLVSTYLVRGHVLQVGKYTFVQLVPLDSRPQVGSNGESAADYGGEKESDSE